VDGCLFASVRRKADSYIVRRHCDGDDTDSRIRCNDDDPDPLGHCNDDDARHTWRWHTTVLKTESSWLIMKDRPGK